MLWQASVELHDGAPVRRVSPDKLAEIMEIGADFYATSMEEALALAFQDDAPRPATEPAKKAKRRALRVTPLRAVAAPAAA